MTTEINWTRDMLSRFREAHAEAVRANQTEFVFDGNQFLTDYAKYLIEYLVGAFGEGAVPKN